MLCESIPTPGGYGVNQEAKQTKTGERVKNYSWDFFPSQALQHREVSGGVSLSVSVFS